MRDSDRFKLYFGPYKTPRFKYGKKVWCEYRGWVKIVGLSDGKIQWPIGRPISPKPGRDSLVIYGDLKRAIEQESNLAVAHWWGVAKGTVRRWRRALGVERNTPGTVRTRDVTLKAESRRAKIAESRRGKPRPKHVHEALRKSHLGKPLDAETREKVTSRIANGVHDHPGSILHGPSAKTSCCGTDYRPQRLSNAPGELRLPSGSAASS